MHEYTPFAITIAVIVAGILFNKYDLNSLRNEIAARFEPRFDQIDRRFDQIDKRLDRIEARITVIEGDLRSFYSVTGKHEARIDILERDRRS